MIYLDTSALVKLVRREEASDALVDWLWAHPDELLVSSTLAEVELPRALRRTEPALLPAVPALLGRIAVYEIDELVRATAAAYDDPGLRSPDAIHFGTADAVLAGDLTGVRQLRPAARRDGPRPRPADDQPGRLTRASLRCGADPRTSSPGRVPATKARGGRGWEGPEFSRARRWGGRAVRVSRPAWR